MDRYDKKNSKRHFETLQRYDELSDEYYFARRAEELKKILIRHSKDIKILDIGCATGEFMMYMNSIGYENVYGLDLSLTLLNTAKNKGVNNLLVTDGNTLPFADNEFDFIVMADVIEHISDYRDSLIEVYRVLIENGKVVIIYPNPNIVPLLNFFADIGIKLNTKENKIYFADLKKNIEGFFYIDDYRTIILGSKLPHIFLEILGFIEKKLPKNILNTIGFAHILILRKK